MDDDRFDDDWLDDAFVLQGKGSAQAPRGNLKFPVCLCFLDGSSVQ